MDYGPRPERPKNQPGAYAPPLPKPLRQRPNGTFGGPGAVIFAAMQAILNNQNSTPYKAGRAVGNAMKRR